MNKCELMQNTLGLDDIVYNLPNDCETEMTLKIKKENNKYGILSFEFKNQKSELISNVKVHNSNNLIDTYKTNGSIRDYEEMCLSVKGVESVEVYPLKDEKFNPQNGHIACVIRGANGKKASNELIQTVKDYIDPNDGTGEGQAPIGATVHILSR